MRQVKGSGRQVNRQLVNASWELTGDDKICITVLHWTQLNLRLRRALQRLIELLLLTEPSHPGRPNEA